MVKKIDVKNVSLAKHTKRVQRVRKLSTILLCKRCGHEWLPRIILFNTIPKLCPRCKSAYWNIERDSSNKTKRKQEQ